MGVEGEAIGATERAPALAGDELAAAALAAEVGDHLATSSISASRASPASLRRSARLPSRRRLQTVLAGTDDRDRDLVDGVSEDEVHRQRLGDHVGQLVQQRANQPAPPAGDGARERRQLVTRHVLDGALRLHPSILKLHPPPRGQRREQRDPPREVVDAALAAKHRQRPAAAPSPRPA